MIVKVIPLQNTNIVIASSAKGLRRTKLSHKTLQEKDVTGWERKANAGVIVPDSKIPRPVNKH